MNTLGLKKLPNGNGSFGECYILDNNTLYKKFYKLPGGDYPFTEEHFSDLVGIENNSFVFPRKLETEDGYVTGYLMDYIHAKDLEALDFDYSITDFLYALDSLKDDIYKLSDEGIVVMDVNFGNILFDDKFHIIDTDLYCKDIKNYYGPDYNEDYIVNALHYSFTNKKNRFELSYLISQNDELSYFDARLKNEYSINAFKDFLISLREVVSSLEGEDIDNLKRLYQGVARVR